jgi:hypothetical protein
MANFLTNELKLSESFLVNFIKNLSLKIYFEQNFLHKILGSY